MANSCWIIPQILSPKGDWVDSKLYKDLLDYTSNNRNEANKVYEYVHSDEFISKFGDWINNKVKNTDSNGEPLIGAIDILSIPEGYGSKLISNNVLDYQLKSLEILQSDRAKQIFSKGEKAGWDLNKILTELAVPKEQKQLLLVLGVKVENS